MFYRLLTVIRYGIGVMILLLAWQASAQAASPFAKFTDFKGKWVFINYFADWCPPCHEEIPQLNAFYQQHKNKDAVVVGIHYDASDAKTTEKVIQRMAIAFPILALVPQSVATLAIAGLPTTVLLSPQEKITRVLMGPQTVQSLQAALMDAMLQNQRLKT